MNTNKSTETDNLLTEIFTTLRNAGLVRSAQAFSTDYLQRNRNWYAYQKHAVRDFSFGSAVACLRAIHKNRNCQSLTALQLIALQKAESELASFLARHHAVAAIVTKPS